MARVLIIEDEVPLQKALLEALASRGLDCISAADGEEGLEKALKERPDVIVLDITMPKKDGFSMLGELRRDPWGVSAPVLILSNLSPRARDVAQSAIELSPSYYVEKSEWSLEDIAAKIEDIARA